MIFPIKHLPQVILIGVQTENGVEPVGFDLRAWLDVWDDIQVTIWPTRPGEAAAYPAANTELVGTVLYWYPNEVDTAIAGTGKVELLGLTADRRKLSGWCDTMIRATSLGSTQEPPEAAQPWVDEVIEAADRAEEQADRAQKIADGLIFAEISGAVRYDQAQTLTDDQKALARQNIGAGTGDGTGETVEVDATLTKAGAAADAAETGKRFDALSQEIAKLPTTGGTQSDWSVNDEADPAFVKNRTHWLERSYEPIVVTPDMVGAEGVDTVDVSVPMGYPAGTVVMYKISDHLLTVEDSGVSQVYIENLDGTKYSGPVTVTEMDGVPGFFNVNCTVFADNAYNNEETKVYTVATSGDFTEELGIVIPSTGLYIVQFATTVAFFEINADTYHTINKRYLPPTNWSDLQGEPTIGWSDLTGTPDITWAQLKSKPAIKTGTASASLILNSALEASGQNALAEGISTTASGNHSHAEGSATTASGLCAHAEGDGTTAGGVCAHAEGKGTTASGYYSHAEGEGTIASGNSTHAQGTFNIEDASGKYIHIVGNGTGHTNRSNAHTLDRDGNAWYAGDVYVGSTSGKNRDEGSQKLVTQAEVDKTVKTALESVTGGSGGTSFKTDETLTLKDGILSVNTADDVEQDNTLPVTSAAVFAEVGNINALLGTI